MGGGTLRVFGLFETWNSVFLNNGYIKHKLLRIAALSSIVYEEGYPLISTSG